MGFELILREWQAWIKQKNQRTKRVLHDEFKYYMSYSEMITLQSFIILQSSILFIFGYFSKEGHEWWEAISLQSRLFLLKKNEKDSGK